MLESLVLSVCFLWDTWCALYVSCVSLHSVSLDAISACPLDSLRALSLVVFSPAKEPYIRVSWALPVFPLCLSTCCVSSCNVCVVFGVSSCALPWRVFPAKEPCIRDSCVLVTTQTFACCAVWCIYQRLLRFPGKGVIHDRLLCALNRIWCALWWIYQSLLCATLVCWKPDTDSWVLPDICIRLSSWPRKEAIYHRLLCALLCFHWVFSCAFCVSCVSLDVMSIDVFLSVVATCLRKQALTYFPLTYFPCRACFPCFSCLFFFCFSFYSLRVLCVFLVCLFLWPLSVLAVEGLVALCSLCFLSLSSLCSLCFLSLARYGCVPLSQCVFSLHLLRANRTQHFVSPSHTRAVSVWDFPCNSAPSCSF